MRRAYKNLLDFKVIPLIPAREQVHGNFGVWNARSSLTMNGWFAPDQMHARSLSLVFLIRTPTMNGPNGDPHWAFGKHQRQNGNLVKF